MENPLVRENIHVVGAGILAARHAQHITRAQLAARAGVPVASVASAERGSGDPDVATLTRVACALGVELRDLLA